MDMKKPLNPMAVAPHSFPAWPPSPMLAHAYVPFQHMGNIFNPMEGLCKGTIFPELYRPYGVDPEYTVDA